jgi:hypothetical protein
MTADVRTLLYLEAVVLGVTVQIRVNDIPQTRLSSTTEPMRAWLPMPSYVQRGSNRLSFRFAAPPPPVPSTPPDAEGPPEIFVNLRIARFAPDEGAFENAGTTLAKLIWTSRARAEPDVPFESPLGPLAWSWARCEPLTLDPPTVEGALRLVREIEQGYRSSDASVFIRASEPKIRDMDEAFPNRSREEIVEVMSSVFAEAHPERVPEPVRFAPALCGDGRLLECLGSDGKSYVRKVAENGAQRYLGLIIGRLDGRWQVIR